MNVFLLSLHLAADEGKISHTVLDTARFLVKKKKKKKLAFTMFSYQIPKKTKHN